jgi:large subunit ribosomal protein L24
MLKFKKGDTIKVTLGKDKGKEGKVEVVLPKKGTVIIPGINIYKKHVKANLTADGKGGVYELPRAINVAKIALICPNCKKQTRVGFKMIEGKKERICRKCGKKI